MPGRNFRSIRNAWLDFSWNRHDGFLSETRPNHPPESVIRVQRPDLLMISVFSTIKLMGSTLESTGLSMESGWTRQLWFHVFHFEHDFEDFGVIFVSQASLGQIRWVFHRKLIVLTFLGMSLNILSRMGWMKLARGLQNTSKQIDYPCPKRWRATV